MQFVEVDGEFPHARGVATESVQRSDVGVEEPVEAPPHAVGR